MARQPNKSWTFAHEYVTDPDAAHAGIERWGRALVRVLLWESPTAAPEASSPATPPLQVLPTQPHTAREDPETAEEAR